MNGNAEEKDHQLEALNQHLDEVRQLKRAPRSSAPLSGDAARAAIDFASASAVGSLLGYGFDRWQGTLPWGLIIGLMIGTAAGVKLMFQAEARRQKPAAPDTNNERNNDAQE